MKLDLQHISSAVIILLLGWGSFQLYGMNANVAVISYKVEENYKMIKPMWQDFLVRSANNANIQKPNDETNFTWNQKE
tara:strand:- start:20486 stop:20719 length:234 start_codon:yes stop_codon:yes gene_type:complete